MLKHILVAATFALALSAFPANAQQMTAVVYKRQPLRSLIPILFYKAGIPVEIQQHPWARAYRMALDESNIFIGPFLRTSQRESRFKWLEVPAFTSRGFLY